MEYLLIKDTTLEGIGDVIREGEGIEGKVPVVEMEDRLRTLVDSGGSEPQFGDDFPILDGKTHIWLKYPSEGSNRTFVLNFRLNSGTLTIDYGDGTAETFSNPSSATQTATHEYATGDYMVTVSCDGQWAIGNTTLTHAFGDTLQRQNVYLVEIGYGCIGIGHSAFNNMGLFKKLAINVGDGNELTTYSNSLYNCPAIESVNIYSGTTYSSTYQFPSSSNYSLIEVDADRITSPVAPSYRYAYGIQKVTFPETVTKILNSTMGQNYAITELIFPKNVDSLASYCVQACTNIKKITFKGTPTSIVSTAFQSMTQQCDVYVPWGEDEVANSPWGLTGATIHYNYTEESEEE